MQGTGIAQSLTMTAHKKLMLLLSPFSRREFQTALSQNTDSSHITAMQSLRTSRNLAARLPRRTPVTARRTYAEVNQRGPGGEPSANAGGDPKNTTNIPLCVLWTSNKLY